MTASVLLNGVRVSTATTGTGTITLGSATTGSLTVDQAASQGSVTADGNLLSYVVIDPPNMEIGQGTYTASGTTLTRTTVFASTNSGSKISLSGNAVVAIIASAQDLISGTSANQLVRLNSSGKLPALDGSNLINLPASGAMLLVSTQVASNSASLQWTGLGTNKNYLLTVNNLLPVTSGGVTLRARFGEGATPTWETSGYNWSGLVYGINLATSSSATGISSAYIALDGSVGVSNAAATACSGMFLINDLTSTTVNKKLTGMFSASNAGYSSITEYAALVGGTYTSDQNAVTAIELYFSSGNISSGQASLYELST
jgi:hypothetical protein